MPVRTARTAWTGTLETGQGQVEMTGSKVGTYDVSFPKRAADDAGGTTSPEELIAAAHSSCYAMQLSAMIAGASRIIAIDKDPFKLELAKKFGATDVVDAGNGEDGGMVVHLGVILIAVAFAASNAYQVERDARLCIDAKAGCPVSKALTGVEITLDAALAS